MVKKILIGLGVLAAVLAVAVIGLIAFVDVDRFKPQIQQAVKERFDRTLTIDGKLSLAVFPRIGVALPRTTLSERGRAEPFASLDGARVSVALFPLLGGRIEADRIRLDGLTATLERRADGSTNIDDFIRPAQGAPKQPAAEQKASVPQFEIGGIELVNANLTYRDLAAKNTVTLSQLNLSTGRLAPKVRTPVELATQFGATQPEAKGELKARGELDLDLAARRFGGSGLDLQLKATLDKRALEASGKAAALRFDAASGALSIDKLDATAKGGFGGVQLDEAKASIPALAWAPQEKRLSVNGLQVAARGTLGADANAQRFDATVAAPKLDLTADSATGERVTATVKLAGGAQAAQVDASVALEGLSGSAAKLAIGKLALNATLQQPLEKDRTRRVVAALASPATASLDAQTFALASLAGEVTMEDPALPQKSVKLPITGTLSVDAKKQLVDARVATRLDDSALNAEVGVRGFSPVKLSFEASADKLDLDRYFPPAPAQAGGGTAAQGDADPKVDLSALKALDLNGQLRVGQLKARGVRTQDLRVVLRAGGGRLAAAPVSARLYGGSVNATAFAQADNRLGLDATLSNVDVGPLLKDALDKDILAGRGNVKLDLTTAGATVGGLKRGLNGDGALQLRDGAVKGINVAKALRNARALLTGGQTETSTGSAAEQTDFSEMSASFTVKNGVARSDDLDLKSPLLRVGGAGQVDLPAGTLDYTVRASVVGSLKGQDGREISELRGVTVPVKLSGPFDKISYTIDWGSVAKDALKSRATEQLKERLAPKADEQRKKIEERARDALKGLFGR